MLICCPNEVRKMYGLPAWVISAASAPTIWGTSANCASTMLALTEPENTGPRITYGSPSIAFCTCAREMPGLLCVSACGALILRFRMPPFALISSIASTAPSRKLVPDTAPAPESSITIGMFTVCCADALPATSAKSNAPNRKFIPSSSEESFQDIRLDHGAQLGRHFRIAAEPLAKTEARLLQQHPQAVDGAMPALARCGQKLRFERHVHDVIYDGGLLERAEVDLERRLARE